MYGASRGTDMVVVVLFPCGLPGGFVRMRIVTSRPGGIRLVMNCEVPDTIGTKRIHHTADPRLPCDEIGVACRSSICMPRTGSTTCPIRCIDTQLDISLHAPLVQRLQIRRDDLKRPARRDVGAAVRFCVIPPDNSPCPSNISHGQAVKERLRL